ncbi:MAG TPA: hypothetical protein VKU83_06825, partial [Puia sp.]|nr:hypothetical protein [Puia sp.]
MKALLFLCCCFGAFVSRAQQRQHRSLDQDWRFHFGDAADPAKDFNYSQVSIFSKSGKAEGTAIAPKFDDRDWRHVSVPHDWAVELPFEYSKDFDVMAHGYKPVGGFYPATSIGWYRKRFEVARTDSGQRFVLQFDGVFRDCKVWLNGFYCCSNASGYS